MCSSGALYRCAAISDGSRIWEKKDAETKKWTPVAKAVVIDATTDATAAAHSTDEPTEILNAYAHFGQSSMPRNDLPTGEEDMAIQCHPPGSGALLVLVLVMKYEPGHT